MTERTSDPEVVCPFVAFDDDRDYRSPVPDHRHRCFAESPAAPRALAHQAAYCLSPAFSGCPTFLDWARREAAPSRSEPTIWSPRDQVPPRSAPRPSAGAPAQPAGPGQAPAAGKARSAEAWAAPPPWAASTADAPGSSGAGQAPRVVTAPISDPVDMRPGQARPGLAGEALNDGLPGTAGNDQAAGARPALAAGAGAGAAALAAAADWPGGARAPEADTPAFIAARDRPVRGPSIEDQEASTDGRLAPDADRSGGADRSVAPSDRSTPPDVGRVPRGYAPAAQARDPHRIAGPGREPAREAREHRDTAAPSWERPRRLEAYPNLKSRGGGGGLPRPAMYAIIIVLVGAALFAAPFILRGFGGGGSNPTPSPSPSVVPSVEPSQTPVPTPASVTYTVKKGDVLSRIAQKFGVTVAAILAANPQIKNENQIGAGDVITIPRPQPSDITSGGSPSP